MILQPSAAGFYVAALRMPADTGLFFYWFEIETDSRTVYQTADRNCPVGGAVQSTSPPRFQVGEAHYSAQTQVNRTKAKHFAQFVDKQPRCRL